MHFLKLLFTFCHLLFEEINSKNYDFFLQKVHKSTVIWRSKDSTSGSWPMRGRKRSVWQIEAARRFLRRGRSVCYSSVNNNRHGDSTRLDIMLSTAILIEWTIISNAIQHRHQHQHQLMHLRSLVVALHEFCWYSFAS